MIDLGVVRGGPEGPVPGVPGTFAEAFAEYARRHAAIYQRPSTRKDVEAFGRRFGERVGRVPLRDIQRPHVEDFILGRLEETGKTGEKVSRATVNKDVRYLRAVFNFFRLLGWVKRNPTRGIRMFKVTKKLDNWPEPERVLALLDWMDREHLQWEADLLRLVCNTGVRLGEALYLRREDIDLERGFLEIRERPEYAIKDYEERRIKLNDVSAAVLRRRMMQAGESGWLFPRQYRSKGAPPRVRSVSRRLKKLSLAAQVPGVTSYGIRHMFATILAGVATQEALMATLGHAKPETANKYYIHRQRLNLPAPPTMGGGRAESV